MIDIGVTAVTRRLAAYAELAWFAAARWQGLGETLTLRQLYAQVYSVGIAALPTLGLLAALAGAAVLTQVMAVVGQDSELAQRFLFYGLVFELSPLLTAFVIVARSSAAMASELAVMHLYDEFTTLRRMGVPPADYLLLPRIFGLMLALPALTVFFQCIAVASGWLAVALVQNQSLMQLALRFVDSASPGLLLFSVLKSALMGGMIGVIACHHGTAVERKTQAVTQAAIQAVGGGMVAVFIVDVLCDLAAYWLQ